MKLKLALAIFISLIFSTSCSRFSIIYPYADWYMEREVNKYLCLEGELEKNTDQVIQNFLYWHQKTTFPMLVTNLKTLMQEIKEKKESKETIVRVRESSLQIWWQSMDKFKPEVKSILTQLERKNIKCLEEHLEEKWKEETEELEDEKEDYIEDKQEEYIENWEDYVGSFTKEQKNQIKQIYRPSWEAEKLRKTQSHKRRVAFLNQLKAAKKSKETMEEWSEKLLTVPYTLYKNEDDWKKEKEARSIRFDKTHKIMKLLNEKQRSELIKTIQEYSDEFLKLTKRKTWKPSPKFQKLLNKY